MNGLCRADDILGFGEGIYIQFDSRFLPSLAKTMGICNICPFLHVMSVHHIVISNISRLVKDMERQNG